MFGQWFFDADKCFSLCLLFQGEYSKRLVFELAKYMSLKRLFSAELSGAISSLLVKQRIFRVNDS